MGKACHAPGGRLTQNFRGSVIIIIIRSVKISNHVPKCVFQSLRHLWELMKEESNCILCWSSRLSLQIWVDEDSWITAACMTKHSSPVFWLPDITPGFKQVESGRGLQTDSVNTWSYDEILAKSISIDCGPEHGKTNIHVYTGPSIYILAATDMEVVNAVP